jgi:hypothetical protein
MTLRFKIFYKNLFRKGWDLKGETGPTASVLIRDACSAWSVDERGAVERPKAGCAEVIANMIPEKCASLGIENYRKQLEERSSETSAAAV